MDEKLWSRKEICEALKISARTLGRRIDELGISSVDEFLPNGAVSKKIRDSDFNKIAAELKGDNARVIVGPTDGKSHAIVVQSLKLELVRTQSELEHKTELLERLEADKESLAADKARLEAMNERLFQQFTDMNEKFLQIQERVLESNNKKAGFLSRLFGK